MQERLKAAGSGSQAQLQQITAEAQSNWIFNPNFLTQERLKAAGSGSQAQLQQATAEAQAKMAARMRESEAAWRKQLEESQAEVARTASHVQKVGDVWLGQRCGVFACPPWLVVVALCAFRSV